MGEPPAVPPEPRPPNAGKFMESHLESENSLALKTQNPQLTPAGTLSVNS